MAFFGVIETSQSNFGRGEKLGSLTYHQLRGERRGMHTILSQICFDAMDFCLYARSYLADMKEVGDGKNVS